MKKLVFLFFIAFSAHSYQCAHFFNNENKMEAFTYVIEKTLGYASVEEFCESRDYLDLEINFMPNYFKYQEEDDDHYKMMIHKSYSSCTFIYNSTKKFVTDKSCYSTW